MPFLSLSFMLNFFFYLVTGPT